MTGPILVVVGIATLVVAATMEFSTPFHHRLAWWTAVWELFLGAALIALALGLKRE